MPIDLAGLRKYRNEGRFHCARCSGEECSVESILDDLIKQLEWREGLKDGVLKMALEIIDRDKFTEEELIDVEGFHRGYNAARAEVLELMEKE